MALTKDHVGKILIVPRFAVRWLCAYAYARQLGDAHSRTLSSSSCMHMAFPRNQLAHWPALRCATASRPMQRNFRSPRKLSVGRLFNRLRRRDPCAVLLSHNASTLRIPANPNTHDRRLGELLNASRPGPGPVSIAANIPHPYRERGGCVR